MSRTIHALVIATTLSCAHAPVARAVAWSIGAHLGFAEVTSPGKGNGSSTVVAFPASAITYEPGLRFAASDRTHANEWLGDAGLFSLDEGGSPLTLFVGMLGYQRTFLASAGNAPFVNVGAGIYREQAALHTTSSSRFGAGIGFRHRVRESRGDMRAEFRIDHLRGDAGRPPLDSFQLRLGFDLWM
jgi:hypothetical protein